MMPSAAKINQADDLMERASEALVRTRYFQAEQLALKALSMARHAADYDRMARICMPLQEARRQRAQQAFDVNRVSVVKGAIRDELKIKPGCYLVQPPHVGADARKLRIIALEREVPAAVVCREPQTQLGHWPIVAICPGYSIRTRVDPPARPEKPDMAWFIAAMEALGDEAIATIDSELEVDRRVDALLLRLDAHPDHEKLHQALAASCRQAAREVAEQAKPATAGSERVSAARVARASVVNSAAEAEEDNDD